ncbi:glycoside hydrolase family 5 protein [Asticcacaulis sp. SL142]|uniref:glycoside hydrolase family 5 protein n=1 Tax=Asticcacaulis sp. SL142 TaxID=2995155 RepID=UPI00226C8386|nr:glycoside hydrolase family 5 protein [Asticcacaulis sp. SL142]WAC46845.1 glycoside hydrolase family 5 protein [Asticcacaulis sp. SL142]
MTNPIDPHRRKFMLAAGAALVPMTFASLARGAEPGAAQRSMGAPVVYPSYNTRPLAPDASSMASKAIQIAARIKLGFNIGNTLEAIGGENAWGNPDISQALVNAVKARGFDAIRLPCAWNQYADQKTAKISEDWLNRVKTVVQYCINADMYVVLNIHWDGGWLENNVTVAARDRVIPKQRAFWEQIATHLRDYDERLIFASANEPNCKTAEQMEVLYAYHQTFVDTVRSTGGKNAYRTLVLQLAETNIELAEPLWNKMPADTVPDRLMVEAHYYTPAQFAIISEDASWGKMFYYWGKDFHSTLEPERNATWGEEDTVDEQMAILKRLFTDKGIPVILGEYGAMTRKGPFDLEKHLASRNYWLAYVTQMALENGVVPFLWDTGDLIDRRTQALRDPQGLNALLIGAGKK